ncbi:transposable element Tcb1 transposase [Trichonephila clavipes]|nr:transposable element Tcb1 transposase [Trichonephila clavipes]
MRICDHWMQEGTTDRRGRSHPPHCTTSREERQIVSMAVMDHSVTSRTIAQHIESVTHHSVSARTIRRRLQYGGLSARRPLLGLPLTQNHRRLRRQCLETPWREDAEQLRYAPPHWSRTGYYGMGGIGYHSHTPLVRIAGTLNSQRYISEIELLLWLARCPDLSPIENMWSMVAQPLTQITPPTATPDQLWQRVEAAWSAVPQEHIQSLIESIPRCVAAVISNNGGYSGY